MTLDIGNTDRLNIFRQEAQRLGIRVLAPNINRSDSSLPSMREERIIFYALAAVKGVGRQAMDHVVALRSESGPFRSIADFARRIDPRLVNKRAFESLVRVGRIRWLHRNRHQLVRSADVILGGSALAARERESGQSMLFGGAVEEAEDLRLVPTEEWLPHDRLNEEFGAIGFYLSGHPLDGVRAALKRLGAVTVAQLGEDRRRSGFRACSPAPLSANQERRGRNDQQYAFVSLSDPTGMFEVMVFSEVLMASRQLLEAGKSVLLKPIAVDWKAMN